MGMIDIALGNGLGNGPGIGICNGLGNGDRNGIGIGNGNGIGNRVGKHIDWLGTFVSRRSRLFDGLLFSFIYCFVWNGHDSRRVELIGITDITMPRTMMSFASFVVSAIGHRLTLCGCDMSRYTIQSTHLHICPRTLDYSSTRHRTTEVSTMFGLERKVIVMWFDRCVA